MAKSTPRPSVKEGGYSQGGRDPGKSSSGPRLTDSSGPSDRKSFDESNFKAKGMNAEAYKSPENQTGEISGVRDTSSGMVRELKRSSPQVGVYQSGDNPRGGEATKSYDSSVDSDLEIRPGWLDELRGHQDSAARRSGGKEDD